MTEFHQSGPDAGISKDTPPPAEIGKVLATFYVSAVTRKPNDTGTIALQATVKGPNNWSHYTPAGTLELTTVNKNAVAWFETHLGKDVRITFDDIPDEG